VGAPEKEITPPPISVRVNWEERQSLERRAGELGISAYVRRQLFDANARSRVPRTPKLHTRDIARLLALLGSAELSTNLHELAAAVRLGAISVSPDTNQAIINACAAVEAMRSLLIVALGAKEDADDPQG
jgi:hypothetical protein